jgi:hypothetical protein
MVNFKFAKFHFYVPTNSVILDHAGYWVAALGRYFEKHMAGYTLIWLQLYAFAVNVVPEKIILHSNLW